MPPGPEYGKGDRIGKNIIGRKGLYSTALHCRENDISRRPQGQHLPEEVPDRKGKKMFNVSSHSPTSVIVAQIGAPALDSLSRRTSYLHIHTHTPALRL